ncbi:peptidyl-prolyl cis-trans isomerase [Aureococcus anophagefferens]|nr:peptidyl-prolyl cis-trans isomerase [Aureococcus anophagefferens]
MGSSRIARRVSWWIAVTLACADALHVAPAPAASQRVRRSAPPSRRALLAGAAAAATLAQLPRAAVAESKKSADGLEWTDVKVGDVVGKVAAAGDTVTIDYVAWLGGFDGREFSRFEKPIKVTLGEGKIVKGLEAALSDGMRPGGVAAGTIVPPGATLYFEVRLRTIVLSKGIGFGLNFS